MLFKKKKRRILAVDDDPDLLDALLMLFSQEGYEFLAARTGEDGYNKAVREKPDLIILDIMLPGRDGYQIARHLRGHAKTKNIPILFLSAKDTPHDIEKGLKVQADAYIAKPFDLNRLLDKVEQLIG